MNRFNYWCLRLKLALIEVFAPWKANRMLKAENERLLKTIADPMLTGMNIGNGSFDVGLIAPGATLIAGMFVGMFEKTPDAKNYIEVHFDTPMGPLLVTAQRKHGKSPNQLQRAAEAERDALRRELEALRGTL